MPHEILTQILTLVLVNDKQKQMTFHSRSGRRWKNEVLNLNHTRRYYHVYQSRYSATHRVNKSDLLDILLVSRNFYFAGIAAFFGENVLNFENVCPVEQLTATLDLDRRRCIRHIVFHLHIHQSLREWDVALGERLGRCFERLPSLLTARLVCHISRSHGAQVVGHYVSKFREVFEKLKEGSGKKGEEVLRLVLPHYDYDQSGFELEDPDLCVRRMLQLEELCYVCLAHLYHMMDNVAS